MALGLAAASCGAVEVKRPQTPPLRLAYELIVSGCKATSTGGPEADEALLKTWLGVRGRYPYETNLLRAAEEAKPDANGLTYGELTAAQVAEVSACRARADHVAGLDR